MLLERIERKICSVREIQIWFRCRNVGITCKGVVVDWIPETDHLYTLYFYLYLLDILETFHHIGRSLATKLNTSSTYIWSAEAHRRNVHLYLILLPAPLVSHWLGVHLGSKYRCGQIRSPRSKISTIHSRPQLSFWLDLNFSFELALAHVLQFWLAAITPPLASRRLGIHFLQFQ
jgi:hypothetical protein